MTKAVIRNNFKYFTQISNYILCDNKISLGAKGLYAYLFSKPDNWQFFYSIIMTETKESKDKIRNYLKELIDNGYIVKTQIKTEKGQFAGLIIEFTDKAINPSYNQEQQEQKEQNEEKTVYGKNRIGKNRIRKTPTHNNIYNSNNTDYINNKDSVASQFVAEPQTHSLVMEVFKYFIKRYNSLSNKKYVLNNIKESYKTFLNLIKLYTKDAIINKINQLSLSNYNLQTLQEMFL